MLGNIIGGFIVILVGSTLAPTVANEIYGARYNDGYEGTGGVNITGSSSTVLGLTTIFYCLAVATGGIGTAVMGLRQGGLM